MELLIVIIFIWLFFLHVRINDLKKIVAELRGEKPTPLYSSIPPAAPGKEAEREMLEALLKQQKTTSLTPVVTTTSVTESSTSAYSWFKEDLMMKVGALLLLIAFGWFVSYAFANNWIGELGRITLGLITGAMIMVLGLWRIKTKPHQGAVFTVLGSTTVILTLYAARELYNLFTPVSALLLMFATVTFIAFVSVQYNRKHLALAGLLLAGASPFLVAATTPSVIMLNLYLLVIVLGTLWVVYLRSWSVLTFAAFCLVFLYGLPLMFGGPGESQLHGLLFAFLFTAVFFIANIIGLVGNDTEENKDYHLLIALGTGVYLILWVMGAASPEWQSLLLAAWMVVFSVGSFLVYRALATLAPFYIYGGTSVALLAAATAAELDGPALAIAFCIEILILIIIANKLFTNSKSSTYLSVLFLLPVVLSIQSLSLGQWETGIFQEDFAILVVLMLSLVTAGFNYRRYHTVAKEISMTLLTAGALYGLALIWLILHAGTLGVPGAYQQATVVSLVVYTLIGIGAYFGGLKAGRKGIEQFGAMLVGAVVVRLLLVDVWNMELAARIVTFFIIGVLLISTAFIRRSKKQPEAIITETR